MQKPRRDLFWKQSQSWRTAVFRDVHFWVPFTVLLIGLLLLRTAQ